MKKVISFILAVVFAFSNVFSVFAQTDDKIFTDAVQNTYAGRDEAKSLINNLNFTDVPNGHWAKESIARAGALNMIKGYENTFSPNATVSNQESLAFVLRMMGLEQQAQQEGTRLRETSTDPAVRQVWTIGYLNIALQQGLITLEQYNDAIDEDQEALALDPDASFLRNEPVSREQTAQWIVQGINYLLPNSLVSNNVQQKLYTFSDWESVAPEFAQSMELLTANNVIMGKENGKLEPKGRITRAEMAQILANLGSLYYNAARLERKLGTIGGIKDNQNKETGQAQLWRNLYVRNQDGRVDVLQYLTENTSNPQSMQRDAVVYKNGAITGLSSLSEGDQIEYIVNPITNTVLYVCVTNQKTEKTLEGFLSSVDYLNGQIHITDSLDKRYIYSVINGIYGNENGKNYLMIGQKQVFDENIPYGSKVKLKLVNDIITTVEYIGQPTIIAEIRGIVVENNEGLGYLKIVDNNGNEVVKNYYADNIVVEKQQSYDNEDEIGYIDQVFPNFQYDPRDTTIDDIEPGDIVFIRTDPTDSSIISSISASANYTVKYGKIKQFTYNGNLNQMLIEYEDKQTSWFDVANSVPIMKDGKLASVPELQVGDWVKLLVNQAIIQPGYVMESVKEINVEGTGHEISNIIKGQLGAVNTMQNQISLQDTYVLDNKGWNNYQEVRQLNINNKDIEYYHEGKRVSLDYAMQYLKRSDGEVYVALENDFGGERVRMVSFRNDRDEILSADNVINSDGVGNFSIVGNSGVISTDSGTIVRRHGRLVTGSNIMIPDYATVVLNGNNKAAVVDIFDEPGTTGVMIARGRILSVDEGKSFKVQSMSQLTGMKWAYTPVQREFAIDHNTQFITADGIVDLETFIDYTADTVANKVYNIVADGTKALQIVESPYSTKGVRGVIYDKTDTLVSIKDAHVYQNTTGAWDSVSNVDNSMNITTAPNCIVIKNNKVSSLSNLEKGDQIRVITNNIPEKITGSMNINGYIILVEK